MSDQTRQQLQQALEFITNGQRDQARALLATIVKANPNNADAWWMMATAVTAPSEMRDALQNVLRIRPDYPNAQQMLDRVNAQLNVGGAPAASTPPASTVPTPTTAAPKASDMATMMSSAAPTPPPAPTVATPVPPAPTPPSSAAPSSSGTQMGESLDDLFAPPPTRSQPASTGSAPGGPGPIVYTPPPYVPPPPSAAPRKGRSPVLYILIGLVIALVCVCGGCLALTGGSFLAVVNNPTVQAAFGTGIAMIDAPQQLPTDATKKGTIRPNQSQTAQINLLQRHVWTYQGQANESITISVSVTSGVLPYIGLYDASGNLVAKTQIGNSARTQTVTTTLPQDANYSILVGGIAGNVASYTLQVQSGSRQ
jgi:hypothetical protein